MAAVLKPQPATAAQVLDECCRSTEEQQRLAYRELFRPLLWPETFEAAMARKPFRVAICAVARNRSRIALRDVAKLPSTLPRGVPVPPTPGLPPNARPAAKRHGCRHPFHLQLGQDHAHAADRVAHQAGRRREAPGGQ